MNKHRNLLKRITCGAFASLFFLLSVLAALPETVFAAGETYTWKDSRTIVASGGDLTGNNELAQAPLTTNQFNGEFLYQNKCRMLVTMTISADSKLGAIYARGTTDVTDGTTTLKPSCGARGEDNKELFPGVISQYNGKTINIAGERAGEPPETEGQKRVTVTVNSKDPASAAPKQVTLTIKQNGKNVKDAVQAYQQTPGWENSEAPDNIRAVEYEATFSLEPGTYQACETGVFNGCVDFTKKKYEPADIVIGESFNERSINVTIEVSFFEPVNSRRVLGPVDVTLQKADGSGAITTIKTDTNELTPTEEQSVSDAYAEILSILRAVFNGIPPGEYKICVPNLNECQTITKKEGESLDVVFKTRKVDQVTQGYGNDPDGRCPNPLKVWAISKIACPLVTAADTAVQKIEEVFGGMMIIDVDNIFGSSSDEGLEQSDKSIAYYQAWNVFRTLAVAIIVIVGIIMILSEAIGLGFVDAYTIRKILPRLLIALIFIAISWWVLATVVQFFNNLTIWVGSLINFPFKDFPEPNASAWTAVGQWAFVTGLLAAVGPFVILLYALTVFIALLIATFILIIREVFIIFAIVMAPIFIAMFVAPNLEKIGNFWRAGFIALLIMGPVFMLITESGSVLYKVVGQKDPTGIFAALSIVLPLLAIPYIFMKIGGLAGQILGFANDRSKGIFDRLSTARGTEMARRKDLAQKGELFQGTFTRRVGLGKVSSGLNKATMLTTGGGFKRGIPLTKKGRAQWQAAQAQRATLMAAAQGKTPEGEAGRFNDYMLRIQTYDNADEARANAAKDWGMYERDEQGNVKHDANGNAIEDTEAIEAGIKAAQANGGFGLGRKMFAIESLAAGGTGYDDMPALTKAIARVAKGNNNVIDDLAIRAKKANDGGRRNDLTASAGTIADLARKEYQAMQTGAGGPTEQDYHKASMEAFNGIDVSKLAHNRPEAIKSLSQTLRRELVLAQEEYDNAASRGTTSQFEAAQRRLGQAVAQVRNIQDSSTFMSAEGLKAFNDSVIAPDEIPGTPHSNIIKRTEDLIAGTKQAPEQTQVLYQPRTTRTGDVKGFSPVFNPQTDAAGNVVDFKIQQKQVPNPNFNPAASDHAALREAFESARHRGSYDPYDVENIHLAA